MFSRRWALCKPAHQQYVGLLPKIVVALFTLLPLIPQTIQHCGTGKAKYGLCGVALKVASNGV